jgi:hypothetical protein
MTSVHFCFSVRKDCCNVLDSYGEICVGCNCCGRIDEATKWQSRLATHERHLKENAEFDNWGSDPEMRALQEKNVAANAVSLQNKIDKCKAVIEKRFKEGTV